MPILHPMHKTLARPPLLTAMPALHLHPEPYALPVADLLGADYRDRMALLDFQQLMRAQGLAVDLRRLQHDPCYAQHCLGRAIESPDAELRRLARRLSASFILDA